MFEADVRHLILQRKWMNSMIRLENINRYKDHVICDIYPEDSEKKGTLDVNLQTGYAEYELPVGYEYCESHIHHAYRWIKEFKGEEYPHNKTIMWY